MKLITFLFLVTIFFSPAFSKTAEEWKSRSIYQIITDRFARTNGDATVCSDLGNYCGGTFKGIQNNLDYIQGMGFDAIWISPVVANTAGGYHGYWVSNLYEINENFGTPEELKELIDACHEKDIWVMVDVVANHIGYVDNFDYSSIIPFNDPAYFNEYIDCTPFFETMDQPKIETCWLSGLPDLDQNHPFVKSTLLEWVREFVQTYKFDALRIDTIAHVSKKFWEEFSKAAGVYTIGEALNFDTKYIAGYQGPLDAVLNYALYSTLRYAFMNSGTMTSIRNYYEGAYSIFPDITVLGNFVNNHDNPRFLHGNENVQPFKAALAFSIASVGIPMVYYGDEQAYNGGQDPANREVLWTNMKRDSDIYNYLKILNQFRKDSGFYKLEQIEREVDDNFYGFTRGDTFFAFTNSLEPQTKVVTDHPYAEGTEVCNVLNKEDCVKVSSGKLVMFLNDGEVKIYTPRKVEEKSKESTFNAESLKVLLSTSSQVSY